jgi:hypothetical protein
MRIISSSGSSVPSTAFSAVSSAVSSFLSSFAGLLQSGNPVTNIELFNFANTKLTYIGDFAFNECNNLLNDIILKDSITYIGKSCFRNCMKISNVIFNATATSIPTECFYSCNSITNFTFGQNITTLKQIEDNAFYNCSQLSSITIPACVNSLGLACFSQCSNLRTINILSTDILSLEASLFYRCYYLQSCIFNEPIFTSIGDFCFSGCRSLSKIIVPGTVESLGVWCFSQYPSSFTDNLFVADTTSYTVSLVPQTIIFEDPSTIINITQHIDNNDSAISSIFNKPSDTTRDITIRFYNSLKLLKSDARKSINDLKTSYQNTTLGSNSPTVAVTSISIPIKVTSTSIPITVTSIYIPITVTSISISIPITVSSITTSTIINRNVLVPTTISFPNNITLPTTISINDSSIFDRLSYKVITSIYEIYKNNNNIKFEWYLNPMPNT